MNEPGVVRRAIRLASIVEGDAVGPHILVPFTLFLRIVTPVHRIPVEVHLHVMLERGPNGGTRVGRGRIDGDGAPGRPTAVVEPVLMSLRPFARRTADIKSLRP